MLSSERAVQVNIAIMGAFVKLREMMAANRELGRKFAELEKRVGNSARNLSSRGRIEEGVNRWGCRMPTGAPIRS